MNIYDFWIILDHGYHMLSLNRLDELHYYVVISSQAPEESQQEVTADQNGSETDLIIWRSKAWNLRTPNFT